MATIYTDQQILDQAREGMFKLISRELSEASVGGDTYKTQDLTALQKVIDAYQTRVDQAKTGFAQVFARPERRR